MLSLIGVACASHSDNVCQDIGDCSHGGSTTWISNCQGEANALGSEAADAGCGSPFEQYYGCADSNYSCQGATATFPGCDQALSALDACIGTATMNTSCAGLEAAEEACGDSTGPDAGTGAQPPPACTAARDCQARCYLGAVANACAPRVDELENAVSCASSCPP
jgi:hypothetical protein